MTNRTIFMCDRKCAALGNAIELRCRERHRAYDDTLSYLSVREHVTPQSVSFGLAIAPLCAFVNCADGIDCDKRGGYLMAAKAFYWQATGAYLYALHLDTGGLAWEYLRRNSDYVRDWHRGARHRARSAIRWGLRFP